MRFLIGFHRAARYSRDAWMLAAGFLLLSADTTSIVHFGGSDLFAVAWASVITLGAILTAFGNVRERPGVEVYGQMLVSAGFTVWGIAAVLQPHVDRLSVAVACVFWSVATSAMYRAEMVASGRVSR